MKNVVVTGASGFIGRHTLPFLAARGYKIYPLRLDLKKEGQSELVSKFDEISPTALLHFAWETTPGLYWHARSNLDWLKRSLDLLEAFVACGGKRVVCAGSCAEYFPSTLYGACKESLRLTAEAFLRKQSVSCAWGRIFFPYGPYERAERLIPSLIQKLLAQSPFECVSEDLVRDFLFVEDIAEGFVTLLESGVEGSLDIGTGEGTTIKEVVHSIASKIGAADLVRFSSVKKGAENIPNTCIADPKRFIKELGFKPRHTLDTGIEKTITWWENEIYH
jgi:nucleoside-diphosphate-sugar epimerase